MLATRQTRLILAAQSYAEEIFTDALPSGDGWTDGVASLQKEFKSLARVQFNRYRSLDADLKDWRKLVSCGEIEFDSARENDFKGALRALVAFATFLIEKFDVYRQQELILATSRVIGQVESHRSAAERILASWKSPEWETANERTVEWNEEQTSYLLKKRNFCG